MTWLFSWKWLPVRGCVSAMVMMFAMLLVLVSAVEAADIYFVSPTGDDDSAGTREAPWRTPEHAGKMAEAGDTVVFESGDYAGRLVVRNSGTAEAPIVFQAGEPRQARLIGQAERNTGAGETHRVLLDGVSHVIVRGFHIEDTGQGGWLRVADSSGITIEDCRFEGGTLWAPFWIEESTQVKILDNDFARRAQSGDMGRVVASEQLLFEGNTFSRSQHSLMMFHLPAAASRNIVVRGNVFHSGWSRNLENVGHPDVLVENNIFTAAYNGGRSAGSVNQFSGHRNIIRFNQVFRNFGIPWQMASGSAAGRSTDHVRLYHNVFYRNLGTGLVVNSLRSTFSGMVIKNSIYADNDPHGSRTQLWIDGGGPEAIRVINTALDGRTPDSPTLLLYGREVLSAKRAQRQHGEVFSELLETAAQFARPETFNFALAEGSPLRDAAAPLTVTRSAGRGDVLPVEDPFYFYDGYGIEGEQGDLIAVGDSGNRARIVEVDHQNRTLRLDREIEWTSGAAVAFPWAGRAPDMGVYEHGENVRPSVQVVVDDPFPAAGDEVELRAVVRGLEPPYRYQWQFGDDQRAQGERVRHRFEPGFDYGVRVRVTDAKGQRAIGVGYVDATAAPSEDVLIHTTFDRDDDDWWVHWQFYRGRRGTGYATYEHLLNERTGQGIHRIAARDGKGPLPAFIHPRDWDIDQYPKVRIRYRIRPGTPLAIFILPYASAEYLTDDWDFRQDTRRHYVAGTEAEPRGDQVLIDDGQWHEITFDVRKIREQWPDVRKLYAMHIGDLEVDGGTPVTADHEFWLDEIYIGK